MPKKKNFIPQKYQVWLKARRRYRLSHTQVQMARELGMNPKKFGSLANHEQEKWKLPLPQFIEECYWKRFHKLKPDDARSIEEIVKAKAVKKAVKKAAKEEIGLKNNMEDKLSI